jgi:glycine/D-amino acid oxidase-like deaminating enzyme/nitrite reductase/ring-hydroxylating ferredoxin subunit
MCAVNKSRLKSLLHFKLIYNWHYFIKHFFLNPCNMFTKSIWNTFSGLTHYPPLEKKIETETLIIGGGITGISLGMELAKAGHKSIIAEAYKIGSGTSSHSTGNLYITIDSGLSRLAEKYDTEVVKRVTAARAAALDLIAGNISAHKLSCDFTSSSWYLCSAEGKGPLLEKELQTAARAGLPIKEADVNEIPFPVSEAIELKGQAQFNPMKYIQQLASVTDPEYCTIYEDTPVLKIEKEDGFYKVYTQSGLIRAKQVVHATHTPKGFMKLQTLLGPYREYGVAYRLEEPLKYNGIFWIFEDGAEYSIRTYEAEGLQYLLIIGRRHKVGQGGDSREHILALQQFAHKHFQLKEAAFRWSGQHYRPADLLPYIGTVDKGLYVATGYATDGLVYGTLAAMMISRQILGKEDPWQALFDPLRKDILKSAGKFLKENLDVAGQYIKRIPGLADHIAFADIEEGHGNVVDKDGHKLAVYRAYDKKLVVRSAICPHMGCVVHFNQAEQTWDCPCHGSRFNTDGSVLEGPALESLSDITGEDGKVKIE